MPKTRKRAPSATEKRRLAERRAELRAAKKRAEAALQRKRSRAAAKGWETRRKNAQRPTQQVAKVRKKVIAPKPKPKSKPKPKRKRSRAAAEPIYLDRKKREKSAGKILVKLGVYPTYEKARRQILQLTFQELKQFLETPTEKYWKRQAGNDENDWYDADGDKHNAYWYH